MRRSTFVALFTILALSISLAACGGGGDDEATPTKATKGSPTSAATTATVAAVATTSVAGATPSAAGGGTGAGPGSGANGTSVVPGATATGNAGGATPTRHPATVVSTPRPIATKAPAPTEVPATEASEPTPTEESAPTPEPGETATEEGGLLTPVLDDTFDDASASYFETGTSEYGTQLTIANGVYTITPDFDSWQTITIGPDDSWDFADGQISATVALQGDGEFGLVSRQYQDENGDFYFYVCWLTPAGDAGCSVYAKDTFTSLFTSTDPSFFQASNSLVMQVIGTEIIFEVNGTQVGTIDDSTVAHGYWGFYAYASESGMTATVDEVVIAVP